MLLPLDVVIDPLGNNLNIFLCFADTSAFCFNEVQGFEDKVKLGKPEGIKWVLRYSDTI